MIVNSVTSTTAIPRAAAAAPAPAPMTAAQAIAALKKNPSALIAVSDSAANISKNFDFLTTSQKNISSLTFSTSDSNLKLSYKQYSALSGNDSFLPSTYKVEITTATSVESVQAFEDEKVSSISINDAAKALAETVAELNSSSIDNYISKIKDIRLTEKLATVELKVEQLAVATALGEKTRTAYRFEITDAAVSDLDDLLKNKKVSKLSIVDTATNIANNVDKIVKNVQKLNNIEISSVDKELNITAVQLRSSQAVLGKITKGYDLALSGATLRDVTQYGNNAKIKSITVLDTSANIAKNISALNQLGEKLTSISQSGKPTTLRLNATDVSANASVLAKINDAYTITATGNIEGVNTLLENTTDKSKIVSVNYVDTAANVQKSLNKLGSLGVQSSINLTDSGSTMVMTGEQINSNKIVLGSIKTPFKIEATNVSISQLKDIAAIKNISTLSIVDTAKNIGDGINAVAWIVSKVKDITQTDKNGVLSITAAQAKTSAAVLAKIKGGYKLALSMVPAANATSFANDRNVVSIELHDSASNIVANLQSINVPRSKVKTINVFDRSTTIASNLYELSKIKNSDVKIKQSDPQNVIALKANDLIANKSFVSKAIPAGSVAIRDTADNIANNIDNIATITDQIRSITRADASPLKLSSSQISKFEALQNKFTSLAAINLVDSGSNITSNLGKIIALGSQVAQINLTGSAQITATYAEISPLIGKIATQQSVNLTDAAANVSTNLSAITAMGNKVAQINLTDDAQITATYAAISPLIGKLATQQSVNLSDTAANVSTNLSAITAMGNKVAQITLTDSAQITATYAAISPVINKIATQQSVNLTDTAANVSANLSAITAIGNKVAQINLTDDAQITTTYAEVSPVIDKIVTPQSVNLADTADNVTTHLATISNLNNQIRKVTVTDNQPIEATWAELVKIASKCESDQLYVVADTGANISTNLSSITALANQITKINLTDNTLISASYAEIVQISKKFEPLSIFNIVDSVENIYTNIYGLFDLIDNHDNIASVQLTNSDKTFDTWNYPPMYPVVKLVNKISDDISVLRARAWQAKDLYGLANVKTISMSEYLQNIPSYFDDLDFSLPKIIEIKSLSNFLSISSTEYDKYQNVISKISGTYQLDITS